MDQPSLDGALAKIARAREHFDTLKEASEAGVKACAGRAAVEDSGDWKIVRISMREAMPLRISAILGDLFHNLRSALDYVAWELVRAAGGKPGRRTYFPIYPDKNDFRRDVTEALERNEGPLAGLTPGGPEWTLIESLQPYHASQPDILDPNFLAAWTSRLWLISAYSRVDKHRAMHACHLSRPAERSIFDSLTWDGDLVESREIDLMEPMEDGTELARLRFDPSGPEPEVNVTGPIWMEPSFILDLPHGMAVAVSLGMLPDLIDGAEEVVGSFEQFVPG